MRKIIRIESARFMDGQSWAVGEEIGYNSGLVITGINDMSSEYETGVFSQFDIYVNGSLYKSLVNVPVVVEYALPNI